MSSLIKMSSDWPSDDLLMVRITGLAAEAGLGAGVDGFGVSIGKGFIALNILGWPDDIAAGFAVVLVGAGGADFGIVFFVLAAVAAAPGLVAGIGLVAPEVVPGFFGLVAALATK